VAASATGDVFIADEYNNKIRGVNIFGTINTVAGNGYVVGPSGNGEYSGDGGPATSAELSHPQGVAVDAAGNTYIADWENNVIRDPVLGVEPLSIACSR
jgi:hypothetical protein